MLIYANSFFDWKYKNPSIKKYNTSSNNYDW